MDYHSMKRSELQALCKEHKIPANSANSVLADKLSELLNVKQEKQKPRARQRTCIKSSVETVVESESAVSRRQSRKVRFSPEVEYERSGKKPKAMEPVVTETKGRRKSMAKKVDEPAVDNVNTVTDDDVQIPIKVTRSRAHILGKDDVIPTNEKRKQGRRAVKDVEKETDAVKEPEGNVGKVTRSKANTVGKGDVQVDKSKQSKRPVKDVEKESEPVKETVVGRPRTTRSKAQTLTEDSKVPDLSLEVKRKSGRQMEKYEVKVEPTKEVKDVPVRATRSRGQNSNNDSVVANPPAEKKRTRRDDIAVAYPPIEKKRTRRELIAPETVDNADKGTRQSRRNKATVEETTAVNQNESKVETVTEKKVTRSKAPVAKKSSGGKGKIKAEAQQIEEPSEPAGRRNVNRRKSVIQPKTTEVVLPLEEPVNEPARKGTRRKSVVQKPQGKGSKKPVVVKKEKVKETETPESPNVRTRKTVGKKQSKDASEKETKEVASASGSQKSRKRRGDPVIEDQTIETEPVSTRKNSVKKEKPSGVKTPASRTGAKRVKLSGIKQSDSEDHAGKSDMAGTPVSKMANLELDEKVVETEQTPANYESGGRSTRGARSNRKEPIQSAIKEQNIRAGRLSSRKTPGRSTRSGIKADEKKQASESANQSQPLDDAQMVLPEDAEVKPSSDVISPVPSEVSKEAEENIISASESVRSPTEPVDLPEIEETTTEQTQNDEVHVTSVMVSEAEVEEVAVNPEKSVLESPIPEVHETEMELTKSGSTSEGLQNDEVVEEPLASVVQTVVIEESVDISLEQSDIKGKSKEDEASVEPSIVEGVSQFSVDDGALPQIDGEDEKGIEDEVDNREDIQELSADDDKLQGLGIDENDIKDEKVSLPEGSTTHSEPEKEFDVVEAEREPATVPAHSEPANALESDVVPPTGNDVHEIPILGESDDVGSVSATEEYETDPMPSTDGSGEDEGVNNNIKEHEYNTNDQDGESEQEQLTSHYNSAMKDENVGDDEPEPAHNEDMPILHEAFTSSYDQVPEPSQNEDVPELPQVSIKSPDREPEPAVSNEERTEEAELATENDHAMVDENPTIEESSPIEIPKEEHQLPGDLGAYGSPSAEEESPVDDTVLDPPTTFKDNDGDKQEDWGNYSFGTDDLQKPVSADESDEVAGQSTKDDQVSGLQTSSPAVANATDEFFNWTDSTLKALLKTPTTAQVSQVKDRQQSTVRFTIPDEDDTDDNTTQNPDSSLKSLFTTPATTQVSRVKDREQSTVRSVQPDEDDTEGNATEYPDSSWKLLKKTPATTRVSHVKEHHQQSTVRFALPNEDETKGNATQIPDSSLKALFTTPATTREERQQSTIRFALPDEDDTEDKAPQYLDSSLKALLKTPTTSQFSHVKGSEQSTVRFALPDEDDTEGKAPQNPDSSLKPLFATPAINRVSHATDRQESTFRFALPDEDVTEGNEPQNPDSSLKTLFGTPATTRVSHESRVRSALPAEDDNATQNPGSSLKASLTTPATTRVSHAKDRQDSSLKTLFATPATTRISHVTDHNESTIRFALPEEGTATKNPDSVLKTLFATPATTRISHVKDHDQSSASEVNTTQNRDSSLKNLFATPATTRVSRENAVRFTLPDDILDEEGKQEDNATQNQGLGGEPTSESFVVESFEDVFINFFDGKVDDGSGAYSGKKQSDEMKRHDLSSEASHHQSVGSGEFEEENKETQQQKGSEAGNEGADSSLKTLFKTPATARSSHVKDGQQQSAVSFAFPQDSERRETPGGVIEDPKSETFEDFAKKYFDDDQVDNDGSGDRHFDFKDSQMDEEAAGTSHPKGSETGEGTREEM